MRVLLVTDLFAPSTGGTERHVASLADRLRAAGHHAVVVTTTPDAGAPRASTGGASGPVVRLDGWSARLIRRHARPEQRFHPTAPDPGLVRALAALCRAERADVVHAHGWIAHSAVPAAHRADVPCVVSLHDYGLDCAVRSRLRPDGTTCGGAPARTCVGCAAARYGAARGSLLVAGLVASRRQWRSVAAFVANSDAVARAAAARGVSCDVVSPWLAPVDRPRAAPVPGLPPGEFVAYVGALARHKGIAVLTEAWRRTPVTAPLVALGSRPEAGAPSLPPGTALHTDVAHPRVLATLAHAPVTVVPSIYPEPFGLVATEAMWAGSVVVASDTAGLREVLDGGRCGVLVPPGDPVSLGAALVDLLGDGARRSALADAGRLRARELDGLDALVRVYARVIDGQAQAPPASLRT